jgi:hypothetical protein
MILKVKYLPLSDGNLSRISGCQPQLRWWSHWPPDFNFGRPKRNLVAQATILVNKIDPFLKNYQRDVKSTRKMS